MLKIVLCVTLSFVTFIIGGSIVHAQDLVPVKGTYEYTVSENDYFSIAEARQNCIDKAKISALKNAFGETIYEEVVDVTMQNNKHAKDFYQESSFSSVRGQWVKDTKQPVVNMTIVNNGILFSAAVEGMAAPKKATVNVVWSLEGEFSGKLDNNLTALKPKERFFLNFKSPVSGYLAVYLKDMATREIVCLLPYKSYEAGMCYVKGGNFYKFFRPENDSAAQEYVFGDTKDNGVETYRLVLVFSVNSFTKCADSTGDYLHANSVTENDFNKWINGLRAVDAELVVSEKTLIVKPSNNI